MGLRTGLLAACLALLAGPGTPAHAAREADPVEVAGSGADRLLAGDDDGRVCLSIPRLVKSCADTDGGVVTVSELRPPLVGVAVPAAAARIEVRRAGVLLASAPTVAGEAYRGVHAGALRFALVRLAVKPGIDGLRVRALDAAGGLVAVLAQDDLNSALVTGRLPLLSGRSAGARWSLVTQQESELSSSVLDLSHESISRCVVTRFRRADFTGSTSSCAGGVSQDPLELVEDEFDVEVDCPGFRLLHGVVAGSVARVSVMLADGRSRTVRTVPVGDGRRAYALTTGVAAVRAVRLIAATGRARVLRPRLAPLAVRCADDEEGSDLPNSVPTPSLDALPLVTPGTPDAPLAGPPAFRVADGPAGTLCLAIGDNPFRAGGCGIVSPWLGEQLGAVDSYADPQAFALAVPARVATVRLSSPDGTGVRSIPTDPGVGYAGRYAGKVRFAAATFAGAAEPRIDLLDAAGAVLFGGAETDDSLARLSARLGSPRRVAGRAGNPSLWQTTARFEAFTFPCFALTDGPPPVGDDRCQSGGDTAVLLAASCVTHRLSVAVRARAGTRVLADVGASKPRRLPLRSGTGLLTLPATSPLRALTFVRRGRARRVRIDAPPAARQCGWSFLPDVLSG